MGSLEWISLDGIAQCGDGTTASLYQDWSILEERNRPSPHSYLLVFLGGGACSTEEECNEVWKSDPFRLSSNYAPNRITGQTILSNDLSINPSMYQFGKIATYYCSQDLYLGSGVMESGLIRDGERHFQGVLDYFVRQLQVQSEPSTVAQLVVVGQSAGGIGVLNHLDQIRQVAATVGAQELKVIADSSLISDQYSLPRNPHFLDYAIHPLCNQTWNFMHKDLTSLPCCASTHCLSRQGIFLPASPQEQTVEESFLLLDSTHDAIALLEAMKEYRSTSGASISDHLERYSAVGEIAGSRIRATEETVLWDLLGNPDSCASSSSFRSMTTETVQPDVLPQLAWEMPSCLIHGFIFPSLELQHLSCMDYGNDKMLDGVGHSEHLREVCRESGAGRTGTVGDLGMTLWFDIDTWERASVNGTSIKDTIETFISGGGVPSILGGDSGETVGVLLDDCAGPNCVVDNIQHACQSLLELENTYHEVNQALRIIWFIYIGLIVLLGILLQTNWEGSFVSRLLGSWSTTASRFIQAVFLGQPKDKKSVVTGVRMANLSVKLKSTGRTLVKNVTIDLKPGSVNGLLGRSGSGKSTLVCPFPPRV